MEPYSLSVARAVRRSGPELIRDSGLSNYYVSREQPEPGTGRPPDDGTEWQVFNSAAMQAAFTQAENDLATATIYAGGMYCSACSWLIDSALQAPRRNSLRRH